MHSLSLLFKDISVLENKMENQRDQMEKILQFLIEKKDTHINLDAALQMRKEVKETLHQLEEHYNKQLVEIEAKLNRGQEEMETREQANNKLQENTDALILELNQLKTDLEQDKAGLNGDMEKLNNQIEMINIELTQVRADKLKNKGKSADMNIQTSQTGSAKEKKINVRHWDSDSSVEGEDKRLLDLIQQKMRIKKPRKIINLK